MHSHLHMPVLRNQAWWGVMKWHFSSRDGMVDYSENRASNLPAGWPLISSPGQHHECDRKDLTHLQNDLDKDSRTETQHLLPLWRSGRVRFSFAE